jgi:hypothetical protein
MFLCGLSFFYIFAKHYQLLVFAPSVWRKKKNVTKAQLL